jgi:hypothetical protein
MFESQSGTLAARTVPSSATPEAASAAKVRR